MKAIVCLRYGSPDVLELQDVEKPIVNDDDVLIRVHAAAMNPLDWHSMTGKPYPYCPYCPVYRDRELEAQLELESRGN